MISHSGRLYISNDLGRTWHDIFANFSSKNKIFKITPSSDADIAFISLSDDIISYNIKTKTSKSLSDGLYSSHIYDFALHEDKEITFFSATDRGIFSSQINLQVMEDFSMPIEINPRMIERIYAEFQGEPPIREIQKEAIHYANVRNNKIKRWHRNSRLRAFLPTVSFDIEKSIEDNIDIEVVLIDERRTTAMALDVLSKNNTSAKKRKQVIDKQAAVIILQNFLDSRA